MACKSNCVAVDAAGDGIWPQARRSINPACNKDLFLRRRASVRASSRCTAASFENRREQRLPDKQGEGPPVRLPDEPAGAATAPASSDALFDRRYRNRRNRSRDDLRALIGHGRPFRMVLALVSIDMAGLAQKGWRGCLCTHVLRRRSRGYPRHPSFGIGGSRSHYWQRSRLSTASDKVLGDRGAQDKTAVWSLNTPRQSSRETSHGQSRTCQMPVLRTQTLAIERPAGLGADNCSLNVDAQSTMPLHALRRFDCLQHVHAWICLSEAGSSRSRPTSMDAMPCRAQRGGRRHATLARSGPAGSTAHDRGSR